MILFITVLCALLAVSQAGTCDAYFPELECPRTNWYDVDCLCQQESPCGTPLQNPDNVSVLRMCGDAKGTYCASSTPSKAPCFGKNRQICRRTLPVPCPVKGIDYVTPIPLDGLQCLYKPYGYQFAVIRIFYTHKDKDGVYTEKLDLQSIPNAKAASAAGLKVSLYHEVFYSPVKEDAEKQIKTVYNHLLANSQKPVFNTYWLAVSGPTWRTKPYLHEEFLHMIIKAANQLQSAGLVKNIGILTSRADWTDEKIMADSQEFSKYPLFYIEEQSAAMSAIDWGLPDGYDPTFGGWAPEQVWVKQWARGQEPEICGNPVVDFLSARDLNSV